MNDMQQRWFQGPEFFRKEESEWPENLDLTQRPLLGLAKILHIKTTSRDKDEIRLAADPERVGNWLK